MSPMSQEATGNGNQDNGTARAIVKGVSIGLPVAIVGLTLALWLITDLGLAGSFVTAILPGILLGGFGGGLAAMLATMK